MAITARAIGAWAASNATTQTVTLPTHAAGDMLIVRTIRKPFTSPDNTVINTSGWTAVATGVANGSTANGVGVGSMGFKAFYKIATSAAETNPVVTWGTTSAPGAAVAVSYQKAATEDWVTPAGTGGGDATARTSQTSTMGSHISVVSGDLVDFFRGQADDSGALTVPTITQTGVTYNTVTEYPATALLDGTSNDIAADGGYRIATAGTSSAAAVITGTSAASEEHGAWMTRLRVNQNITVPVIGGSGAVAFVQNIGTFNSAGADDSTIVLTVSKTVTVGNTIIVTASWGNNSVNAPTCTDNLGNTYTRQEKTHGAAASGVIFSAPVTTGGTLTTITVNLIGDFATTRTLIAAEFSGVGALSVVGGGSFATSGTATWINNKTIPAGGLAVGISAPFGSSQTIGGASGSPSTSATIAAQHATPATSNALCYAIAGGSNVTGFSGTATFSSDDWVSAGAVFSPAAGAANELYAPTVTQGVGAQTITVPLLDAAPALYAPTVAPQPVTLTVPVLTSTSALYAPTLVAKNTLTVGLIDAAPALYAPSVGFTLTVPLLTSTSALYAPSLGVTVTVPALDAVNALYAPSVGFTITLGTIDAGNALYAPVTYLDQFLTVPLLDAVPALYAPTLGLALTVPLLDASNAVYAPTLAPQPVTLTIPALDAVNALYAPTVAQVGGATQSLTVPLLDASGATYAPTVTTRNAVTLGLLDGAPAVYAPTLTAKSSVTLGLLDASPALYAPTVQPDQFLTLGLIDGGAALYAPAVSLGAYYIAPTGNDSTGAGTLASPWLTLGKFITVATAGDTLYCRGGTYTISSLALITTTPAGSAGSPITVRNYPGEVPVFHGNAPTWAGGFAQLEGGVSYWVFEGLEFENFRSSETGTIWVGDASTSTHHITVRRCTFRARAGGTFSDQQVYLSYNANSCTIEDNRFIGASVGGDGGTGVNIGGHDPGPTGFLVQRNVFDNFGHTGALWIASSATSGSALHNTFVNNDTNIACGIHSTLLIRDNAGHDALNGTWANIDDSDTGDTTEDHNFWAQTFDAAYVLTAGQSGRGAASDGSDAGAIQGLILGLIDASRALYAPTLAQVAGGAQTLTVPLLDAAPALYAPTLTVGAVTLTVPQLNAANAVYAPTVTPAAWSIVIPYLDGAPTVYAPTVIIDQFVTLGTIDGAPAVYAPSVAAKNTLTSPLLDAGPALYAPTVFGTQIVTLGLLDSGPALYAPTMAVGGALALQLLDAGPTLYAPTVTPGAVGITVPQLDGLAALYAPSITAKSSVTLGLLDGSPALYAPTAVQVSGVTVPLLTSTSALYAPTFTVGAVGITVPYLDGVPVLYAPTVTPSWLLAVPVLDGVATVYAPELVKTVTIPLELIDAGAALYPPTLTGGINLPIADLDITDIDPGDLVLVASGAPIAVVSVDTVTVTAVGAGGGVVLSVASSPVAIVDIEVG